STTSYCLACGSPASRSSASFFFSSRRRHTRFSRDWSSDVCSSDLFFIVLVSLLLQGSTLPWAARKARVEVPPTPSPISRTGLEVHPTSPWELFVYRLAAHKWYIGQPLRALNMPSVSRVAALFRGYELLHPPGTTTRHVGDILCVIGQEKDLPLFGTLFSQPPKRGKDLHFFGEFILEGSADLGSVAAVYGLNLESDEEGDLPLGQFIARRLGSEPVVGDQVEW